MKTNWSDIAKDGLILSAVSIVIMLASQLLTPLAPFLGTVFWVVKFAGSIYMLKYLMSKYTQKNNGTTYGQSFNYGSLISFFSSIAIGAFLVLLYYVITPDALTKAVDLWFELMAQQGMDVSGTFDIEAIEGKLPIYIAVAQIIYCSIFGLIASSIIANWTKDDQIRFDNLNEE